MPPKHAFIPKKACDICYAKKTTCSLPNPEGPCERCAHRSLECTFNREKPSKKRKTSKASSDVQILSQRIKQLENALVRAGPRKRSTPDLANPEEPQITASSQVKSRGISTSPSGRERFALSDSSPSSLVFTPPAINTYHYATADHDAGINVSANQLGPNWFFNGMAIFSEEGHIALRTGNPPLLTEDYCDLTAPVNSLHYYTYLPALDDFFEMTNKTHEIITPHLPGDTRLSHLKEKVCRNLFSAQALKDNDDQLLLHIRKLDDEIERWRLSVPTGFRPALFVSQNSLSNSPEEGIPHVIRRMSLQLDYHHLMTVVHTTVRKCTPDAADETEDLHAVVHSSFDLSLVASRSTLACLKALVGTIAEQAFR
ncbi:hypothetical protein PENANT_c001G11830 [Penicillium antarcticum]|uniref:Zn(2)-C6 fungal-type domain-containing protein n=1 Tax=Penicillium antarcticum TaxID=416450 RepID=A0A1V6QMZ7_9EURO|nr:hypothetical protein PENANT_c001G11830 [Penicillium antarcticum]